MLRGRGEAELASEICRIAVEAAGFRFAWVAYAEHDANRTARPIAQFGFGDGYLEGLKLSWAEGPSGNGPTGVAIRTGLVQVAQHMATDPRLEPWRELFTAQGYRSSAALPLRNGDVTFGALNLYAEEANAFDDDELNLLGLLAEDLARAILTARGKLQLSQMQLRLERADRLDAVGRTAAVLAHDMNNALAVALTTMELLGRKLPPGLDSLHAEGSRALEEAVALNHRVLDFARRSSSCQQRLDVDGALEAVSPRLKSLLPQSMTLAIASKSPGARARLDTLTFERLVTNLVANARDAMPNGGTIEIQTEVQVLRHPLPEDMVGLEPGRHVVLRVRDTGSGMTREVREQIFEPFFTTKGTRGTGLGLASAYGIVRSAGGAISVSSEPGKGTTFDIFLPEPAERE